MTKKQLEVALVSRLLEQLNHKKGTDYVAVGNPKEDSEVDVIGNSSSGHPILHFQVATAEGEVIRAAIKNTKSMRLGQGMRTGNVEHRSWIRNIIDKKAESYPDLLKRDLLLVIAGSAPTPSTIETERYLRDMSDGGFLGVYVVWLPVSAYPVRPETENGLVFPVRDVLGLG